MAEFKRHRRLQEKQSFMFETVLSTTRNLDYLKLAKAEGAEICSIYVLTRSADINVERVAKRVSQGGHDVPEDKIRNRYIKCLEILPDLVDVSDSCLIYDNSNKSSIMVRKNEEKKATIITDNLADDEWLQNTITKPLEERNYKLNYLKSETFLGLSDIHNIEELEKLFQTEKQKSFEE